ncbi:MAG: colanic acid biosynthesis glycosyl transferase WcaI [Phycisphaerales bacterium]|nr:colanic acid biosynthesis glycosyl transferase WcaI [Phycisphaerales bacterium]
MFSSNRKLQIANRKSALLVLSQVFVPDPASVGQHMADVAFEMAARGHRVLVYTSARGYENPNNIYPKRETIRGVEIRRLGFASFGKKNLLIRAFGTASFMVQAILIVLTTRKLGGIFFSTSPPLIGIAAMIGKWFRRVPIAYWAMDLNPDQLIAMGKITKTSLTARVLETANRLILNNSSLVVALDRFMADRLRLRVRDIDRKMLVMPPWPHDAHLEPLPHRENPFRAKHDLTEKFVIMYSGNHSPSNPLRTLLEAARQLKDHAKLQFMFVGGGLGKKEVEAFAKEHDVRTIVSLPYQPLADLRYSLSAADVHVVSLGEDMVGIVHPCKIYGAMTVGRPILFLGPRPSHVADILDENPIGKQVAHGDVAACVAAIQSFFDAPPAQLSTMGDLAQRVLTQRFTQVYLCGKFCDALEGALKMSPPPAASDQRSEHATAQPLPAAH